MYKSKNIKRYKINKFSKQELEVFLNTLHFNENSFLSRHLSKKIMTKQYMLTDKIELNILIDAENCIYNDFEDNIIIDVDSRQLYMPFRNEEETECLNEIIKQYNNIMNRLVVQGLLSEK